MEFIFWAIVVLVVLGFIGSASKKGKSSASSKPVRTTPAKRDATSSEKPSAEKKQKHEWLKEKVELLESADPDLVNAIVPKWYFDEPTNRQLEKLKELNLFGLRVKTKGEASDLIGTEYPIDEPDKEVLKFFKVKTAGMCQSEGRFRVAVLMSDEEKRQQYLNRPATPLQKEFYKFVGEPVPKGLTHEAASKFQHAFEYEDENEKTCERWWEYENVYDDLSDADTREDYGIKKVSLSLYREAYNKLSEKGGVNEDGMFHMDELVEVILELKPEVKR